MLKAAVVSEKVVSVTVSDVADVVSESDKVVFVSLSDVASGTDAVVASERRMLLVTTREMEEAEVVRGKGVPVFVCGEITVVSVTPCMNN